MERTLMAMAHAFPRCAEAATLSGACDALVTELSECGLLPSVYFLVDGRLRCQAARGYFQVVDGFTPGHGVIGSVAATGRAVVIPDVSVHPDYIAAMPGVAGEACVPLRVSGELVGAVNVEWTTTPPADVEPLLVAAAEQLGAAIATLGGLPPVPLAQRLARISVELTALNDSAAIIARAVAGAVEISGRTSAALSRCDPDGRWSVVHSRGPLAGPLAEWSDDDHRVIAAWGAPGTSSHFPGGEDVPADYKFLLRAGVKSIAVQPLVLSGRLVGLLTTADTRPTVHDPTVGAAVELLAAQTAASLGVASAITELSERAVRDPLTRLRNAGAFSDDLRRLTNRRDTACLLIDVDHFKAVNDTYGHLVGDQLLCDLAERLTANLRSDDVLYRIGGDEFAAILVNASPAEARNVAQRLVDGARRVRTTVSIGVAMFDAAGSEHAHSSADEALYRAKAAGRDRYLAAER